MIEPSAPSNIPKPREITGHVVLSGTFISATEKAMKFRIDSIDGIRNDGYQKTYWIPISQVHSDFQSHIEGQDWVIITDWLGKKIGLI